MADYLTSNQKVEGSTPSRGSEFFSFFASLIRNDAVQKHGAASDGSSHSPSTRFPNSKSDGSDGQAAVVLCAAAPRVPPAGAAELRRDGGALGSPVL